MMVNKLSRKAFFITMCLVTLSMLLFGLSKTVSAASFQAPDPNFFSPDGNDVLLVASYAGGANGLDSRIMTVMAYFDNPTGNTIIIGNGRDECGIPGNGSGVDGTTPADTDFVFRDIGVGGGFINSMARNSSALSCNSDSIAVPTLKPYTIPGTSVQKYVVKITATNNSFGSINAFRVSVLPGQGVMSYYDQSTRQFAIQDRRDWGPTPGNETTMDLAFGPSCTYKKGDPAVLQWFDDDWGTGNQSSNLRMQLIEDGVVKASNPTSNFQGAGAGGSWDVSSLISPGHQYKWRWSGVSERNGIQFQLPFDSFYYDFDCNPITVVLDPTCGETLKFRVSDTSGKKYDARLRWDLADTGAVLQNLTPGNAPGVNVYEFDISSYKDFTSHFVSLRVVSDSGTVVEDTPVEGVGACAKIECLGDTTFSPSKASPGEPITVTQKLKADIGSNGKKGTLYNAQIVSTGPPKITTVSGGPGDYIPNSPQTVVGPNSGANTVGPVIGGGIGPEPTSGGNTETMTWTMTYPAAGEFNGWVGVTGGTNVNCPFGSTIQISDKPYLRVWRGDVVAGCEGTAAWPKRSSPMTYGRIYTNSLGNGRGSGTDLASQAFDTIRGFTSGQKSGRAMEDYMSLANTQTSGDANPQVDPTWGGRFRKGQCASDYYSGAPVPSSTNGNKGVLPGKLDALVSGDYVYSGGTLGTAGASTIAAGQHVNIYVEGDLTITNNILLGGSGSWADVASVSSLKIVVKGNIFIDHSVSKIEGIFVAQPKLDASDSGGTIITCTNGSARFNQGAAANARTGLIDNCAKNTSASLSVYGALIARNIEFLRLKWSITGAQVTDNIGTSGTPGVPGGNAAEKFIYTPETWLFASNPTPSAGTYDSITSLPPVF